MLRKHDYDHDFYGWVLTQAKLLKKGDFDKVDMQNLIDEVESLGRSEKRTLESKLEILLIHLLKIEYQPEKRTRSWDLSVKESRFKAKEVLKENPSLKPKLKEILGRAYKSAAWRAEQETGLNEKIFPKTCPWTLEDLLK